MNRFFLLISLFLALVKSLNAQEVGQFPYKNISHREYFGHSQNWAVIQDSRGVIYSGNNSGVIEFDGSEWRTISVNNAVTRSLDTDTEGRIWVGAQDELGYLAPDSLGNMTYYSLNHLIDSTCIPFGLVRQVYATYNGVVFSTNNCIFRIKGEEVETWYPKTFFHRTYHVNGQIFSVQPEVGLTMLRGDTLVLTPAGERFANTRIYAMVPYDEETILIATQSEGFFLYNINSLTEKDKSIDHQILKPFSTSNDKFFRENWVYHGIRLPNGWFAFGTYRGGAVVINSQGDVIQYIGKEQGIQDETVWHITLDDQDNLWLALNNGISYSAIKSPITSWDVTMGIQGVLQSVNKYDGTLYVTSNAGTFYKENNIFHRVKGILNLSWDITNVTSSDSKVSSLVATGDGIYQLNGKSASLIKNGNVPTFRIYQSKYHPNIVYLGLYDGLGVAAYEKGEWKFLGRFEGVTGRVYSVTEDNDNNLWFTSWPKSIVRAEVGNPRSLVFDNKEDFSNLPNNPNIDEDTKLVLIGNELKVSSTKGLSYFDTISMTFKPDYSLGSEFAEGEKGVRIFLQDSIGNLWFESYDEMHSRAIERAVKGDGEEFIRIPSEFNEIPKMIFYGVNVQNDNIVWIAGADGLYRFDPTIRSRGIKIPHVLIRKVYAGQKQLLFGGAFAQPCKDGYYLCTGDNQSLQNIPQLPYKLNTVSFHFSSPFFGQKDKMQFSFMLEGYDEDWSEWSTLLQKEYTNLPYGSYKFMVKTLSVYDVESSVTSYSFEIERPWYWHPLVFFMYFLLLLIIVALSVAVKTRMLKASNLKLQGIVDQRTNEMLIQQRDILGKTEELIQQKEEIETQRDTLQHQSLKTSASIQYALTIQQAILPERKILDKYFDNFLIYKPKDVVSGDFYWFSSLPSKVGKGKRLFIAVVDCTGHGVPGAFMSMIGSRMLSEIVNERKIYDPAAILTELDKMLDQVLHRDSNNNFDGMDVCLCAIDQITPEQYLVTFAGANRLVSYYKQAAKCITSIRGNRKSIGGFYPNIDNTFDDHLIDMASGDTLFLYSDGIIDQNNQFDRKFTSSRLNKLFMTNIEDDMDKMGNTINSEFNKFIGDTPQRDDITLVGIRLK